MAETYRVLIKDVETNRDDLKQLINQKLDFEYHGLGLSARIGDYHTSRIVRLDRLQNGFVLTTQNTKYYMQLVNEKMTTEELIVANPILRATQDVLNNQVVKGYAKYGTTVNPVDYTTQQWINHASEEAMDFVVYLQTLAAKVDEMQYRYNEMETALKFILDDTKTVSDYEETIQNVRLYANNGLHS